MKYLFTSESVTSGHPDKICDQISDAILDSYLEKDKYARVACEVSVTTNFVLIFGEVTSTAHVDIENVVRNKIKEIGYTQKYIGFKYDKVRILIKLKKQSPNIALGVDCSSEYKNNKKDINDLIGAGDQGLIFGYASTETKEYMPLSIMLAHNLCKRLDIVRKQGIIPYLRPDGKSQVTVEYENNQIKRIEAIVLSAQHNGNIKQSRIKKDLIKYVINEIIDKKYIDNNTKIYINPTGKFVIGGPKGDSGLTGRKIIVDTYGGKCQHGGGAFSGKDCTKVDRAASYMARYVCKNIVASGLADECLIQVAYVIGVARPVSIMINTYNTGKLSNDELLKIIIDNFDLRPNAIINKLQLRNPIYSQTATYGHFGNNEYPWEKLDIVDKLKSYLNK